jgi:hypothetical protein
MALLSGRLLVFGGEHITRTLQQGRNKPDRKLNDLWGYSVATNTWSELSPGR